MEICSVWSDAPLPGKPFRDRSGLGSIPFYVDRVLQEMATNYDIKDVKGRGLQIYTAIDLGAQDTATKTLEAGLRNLEKNSRRLRRPESPLQGVVIHVDVPTGEIRALVGGRNYDQSQFNRALNSKRLIGSLVKPYVYDAVKPFFKVYGKEDVFSWHENTDPSTHNYQLDNRLQAYRFFSKHFGLPAIEQELRGKFRANVKQLAPFQRAWPSLSPLLQNWFEAQLDCC